jgi:hypothetical protein
MKTLKKRGLKVQPCGTPRNKEQGKKHFANTQMKDNLTGK